VIPLALVDRHHLQSDQFLAALVSSSDDAIIGKTTDGVVVSWNTAAELLYGYSAAEMLGRDIAVLFPLWMLDEHDGLLARARRGETVHDLHTERLHKDGRRIEVSITVSPVIGPDGAVVGVATVAHDLTREIRAIAELRESQRSANQTLNLFEAFQENAPVGFGFVDREFRILRINEMLAAVQGSTVEDQIGRTVAEVVPTIWSQVGSIFRRVLETGEAVVNLEVSAEFVAEPGHFHYALASYFPVRIDTEIVGVGMVVVDITERKNAERAQDNLTHAAVDAIAAMAEARDPYTAGHQRRVAELAGALATELGLADDVIEGIRLAGNIHDIGKVSVPAEILVRPGRLSPLEWEMVKGHPQVGSEIVKEIEFPWPVAEMIHQHHERSDGSGYPRGLRGEEILLGARIIGVADTVEAMSSHRPYRPAKGLGAGLDEITKGRGTLFDGPVVDACLRLFREGRFAFGESQPWMPPVLATGVPASSR
jgi:PAS domain S-box-containing protein/putative nucleotidyltransferase with HDIG domain